MPVNTVPVGSMQKKVVEVPAEYVDAANDALKWVIILLISTAYNKYLSSKFGGSGIVSGDLYQDAIKTALVMGVGFLVYHFVVQKVFVFMPVSGQSTYYMALKRMG